MSDPWNGMARLLHTRLPAHLVRRAQAFTQGRIGKCSPSAGVAYFLELHLPNAEHRARFEALEEIAEAEARARPEPTDEELDDPGDGWSAPLGGKPRIKEEARRGWRFPRRASRTTLTSSPPSSTSPKERDGSMPNCTTKRA